MSGTPRLRSAFPATPQHRPGSKRPSSLGDPFVKQKLPRAQDDVSSIAPVIPLEFIDAATQRLIASAVWVLLFAWKLSDAWTVYTSEDPDSLWQFMKWLLFDGIFLFTIPSLRIPWLEFSTSTMTLVFLAHSAINACLIFQIGLPLAFWAEWLFKKVWDRGEMSVTERFVKTNQVVDTKSLLQGKHVINILPEGSALLNPHNEIFCLGGNMKHVEIPIQINQTQPVLIELLRRDFNGEITEVVTIKASEAKRLTRAAIDHHKRTRGVPHPDDPMVLRYSVKKTGQYTISKILDESKLQVRPRASEVVVVSCPSARIVTDKNDRCRGDLSDIFFEVTGTAPLKLKYRKLVNGNPTEASFQSIQPPDFISPSSRQKQLVSTRPSLLDISWAESQKVSVPINESLMALGKYSYYIDDVEDALGNRIVYHIRSDEDDSTNQKNVDAVKLVTVHDRPAISIPANAGCNAERPLKVAAGEETHLPHQITSAGQSEYGYRSDYNFDEEHIVEYEFFPEAKLQTENEEPLAAAIGKLVTFKKNRPSQSIGIKDPGLYVFKNVYTKFCQGEVSEPSSCLLQNPLKPTVKISSTEITHKCANSPIGLQVTFDFEGTPPFKIRYMQEDYTSGQNELKSQVFNGYRGQIDIRQNRAGRYKYTFRTISDHYYDSERVAVVLEQDVKPSASAYLDHSEISKQTKNICLGGEPVTYPVHLTGDAPWNLEYEIIHGKSRKKFSLKDLKDPKVNIEVADLKEGGEYTLALTSITDVSGCKEFLKDQMKFNVWSQKPTAAFGKINGKYSASILEGNTLRLPLRFTGQARFAYVIEDVIGGANKSESSVSTSPVSSYDVRHPGIYTLRAMRDDHCFGEIEEAGAQFTVDWIPRPSLALAQHSSIETKGASLIKQDVCEGEDDTLDLNLTGSPPFEVKYEEHGKPDEGQKSLRSKKLNVAFGVATVSLDTAKAGNYEYRFQDVSDANYDADSRKKATTVLHQRVRSRPSAKFGTPGHTYSFCTTEGNSDEIVPIKFVGIPPFSIDIDIRHSSSASPESMNVDQIRTNNYDLHLPRKYLRSGHSHLTIRRVRDGRGCQSKVDPTIAPSRVHVSVHDPPNIVPLEAREDYCIGEYFSFRLTGVPPFTVFYTFEGEKRKAVEKTTTFMRFNAMAGKFTITSISDSSSKCQFTTALQKTVHPNPGVKVDEGREVYADIHEGGESEVVFEMTGTPPFEITYTRSELPKRGQVGRVLETKTIRTNDMVHRKMENQGGSIEPLSVRDKWCLTTKETDGKTKKGKQGQKLLMQ